MSKMVIFDMDGVIIDSEPLHFQVDQLVMRKLGVFISHEELEQFVGMTNPEMWAQLKWKYNLSEDVDKIIDFQLSTKIKLLEESHIEPIEGVVDLIRQLKINKIKIGLASSSPRRFIETVLNKFHIIHYFDCIVSGEEVPKGKPAPDIYRKAAELVGVNESECTVIEDSRNGVLSAKAACMKCIGFRNPNSGNQDLSGADMIVEVMKEIHISKKCSDVIVRVVRNNDK
ncbi:HAD family hydrolase [Bacillus salipaludis]|uniref:HAD family hydrolase n=1 Tax=Bacillus salipaludis TaxID=2547811 RepID=A0ABW8RIB6_9BACI